LTKHLPRPLHARHIPSVGLLPVPSPPVPVSLRNTSPRSTEGLLETSRRAPSPREYSATTAATAVSRGTEDVGSIPSHTIPRASTLGLFSRNKLLEFWKCDRSA
jgi:hypothetical protein